MLLQSLYTLGPKASADSSGSGNGCCSSSASCSSSSSSSGSSSSSSKSSSSSTSVALAVAVSVPEVIVVAVVGVRVAVVVRVVHSIDHGGFRWRYSADRGKRQYSYVHIFMHIAYMFTCFGTFMGDFNTYYTHAVA